MHAMATLFLLRETGGFAVALRALLIIFVTGEELKELREKSVHKLKTKHFLLTF